MTTHANTLDPQRPTPPLRALAALTLYLCAAIGGLVATLADVVQKEEASATAKLTSVAALHLDTILHPLWTLWLLVFLSGLLCFVFQPRDRRSAFAIGAGVIAMIMTVTPYDQPASGLPPAPAEQAGGALGPRLAFAGDDAATLRLVGGATRSGERVHYMLENRSRLSATLGVSLFDKAAGREYRQRVRIGPRSDAALLFAPEDGVAGRRFLWRVDVDGAHAMSDSFTGSREGAQIAVDVTGAVERLARAVSDRGGLLGAFDRIQRSLAQPKGW